MRRADRHAQVKVLKETGLTFDQIAARLGLAKSTVTAAYYDPTGEQARARKERACGTCIDCGARTSYATGGPSERCTECAKAAAVVWDRDAIITAIRKWANEHGGIPPAATDWNTTRGRTFGRPPRPDGYPGVPTVQRTFGSWRAAITAAGFDAFAPGQYGRDGEYPEVVAETVALYRSGLSCAAVAAQLGMSGNGVRCRLLKAGEPRRARNDWRQQVAA